MSGISTIKHSQNINGKLKKMHEDSEHSRKFKWKFRAGNQRITNFESFQLAVQGLIGYAGTHVPMFVHKLGLIKPRQT